MSEVIPMHVQGILEDLVIPPLQTLPPHISAEIYFGFDGSGNHHEFRSVKTDSENLILVGSLTSPGRTYIFVRPMYICTEFQALKARE